MASVAGHVHVAVAQHFVVRVVHGVVVCLSIEGVGVGVGVGGRGARRGREAGAKEETKLRYQTKSPRFDGGQGADGMDGRSSARLEQQERLTEPRPIN